MIVAVESELSSAAIVDMAAAKMAAMISPTSPTGMWDVTNDGNT